MSFLTLYYRLLWLEFCRATSQSPAVLIAGMFAMPMIVEDAVARRLGFRYVYGAA